MSSEPVSNPLPNHESRCPGKLVELSVGQTHYQVSGPEDGVPLLLVHGFASWSFAWQPVLPALDAAGFRTYALDLYGRGYSARPQGAYSIDRYLRQINEFMEKIGVQAPFRLMGWSMGGAIVLNFADRYPEKVAQLGMMAPAGLALKKPKGSGLLTLPLVGKLFATVLGRAALREGVRRNFSDPTRMKEFRDHIEVSARYPGYYQALASTLRDMPLFDLRDVYTRVGAQGRKSLLIWGQDDLVCPHKGSELGCRLLNDVQFHSIPAMGHACHWESPDVVGEAIASFFTE